ncbi:dna-bind-domain-containing protein [Diaporthe amygdali]|uniref:dna-bind-domain-containing protein n=1 Tax=Phomopsis amygdali TaxID=1214568 RepID=UPI0022FE2A74|nr:dna-bind-domain-containing protein [Diaporthe amygdali]KAJ0118101.1 dna-bind-domain-containing protein [Diaporthe amygdali]
MSAPTATATATGPATSVSSAMDASPSDALTATPSQQKERHSLSLDQRRALRRWANSQTVRPSHKACIEWFASQYGNTISQSTVSHSLSPKYARLDGDPQLSGSRLRFGNWPDVEKLVLMWHHSMVSSGRQPTNEELADKAKSIFQQLPRYKDEQPPEFSPGWIHRFKKRYGLLIRRQRRHGTAPPPQDDIPYLVDAIPRFMSVGPDTSPAAIRDSVQRIVGVEPSLATCARVRDEVVRRLENPQLNHNGQPNHVLDTSGNHNGGGGMGNPPPGSGGASAGPGDAYGDEDPEIVLQNALHALQQEEADAEAEAAAAREEREMAERGLQAPPPPPPPPPPLAGMGASQSYAQQAAGAALATPVRNGVAQPGGVGGVGGGGVGGGGGGGSANGSVLAQPRYSVGDDLNLTPIPSNGPISTTDRPMRCPFCINQRMLRTIKEAVEHMATHVVV